LMSASAPPRSAASAPVPTRRSRPFFTLSNSLAGALASPRYFAATSLYDGPTTFLSIAWHACSRLFSAVLRRNLRHARRPLPALRPPGSLRQSSSMLHRKGWGSGRMVLEAAADQKFYHRPLASVFASVSSSRPGS
jgi:hypothetical protein